MISVAVSVVIQWIGTVQILLLISDAVTIIIIVTKIYDAIIVRILIKRRICQDLTGVQTTIAIAVKRGWVIRNLASVRNQIAVTIGDVELIGIGSTGIATRSPATSCGAIGHRCTDQQSASRDGDTIPVLISPTKFSGQSLSLDPGSNACSLKDADQAFPGDTLPPFRSSDCNHVTGNGDTSGEFIGKTQINGGQFSITSPGAVLIVGKDVRCPVRKVGAHMSNDNDAMINGNLKILPFGL